MGLLNKLFGQKQFDARLHGTWISDIEDELTNKTIGNVSMTFTQDGKLFYDSIEDEKRQRMNLIYWTTGDIVYTDQPSHPRQEQTKFSFPTADTLLLEFGGQCTKFKRTSR